MINRPHALLHSHILSASAHGACPDLVGSSLRSVTRIFPPNIFRFNRLFASPAPRLFLNSFRINPLRAPFTPMECGTPSRSKIRNATMQEPILFDLRDRADRHLHVQEQKGPQGRFF